MRFAIDIPNFGHFADPHLTAEVARDAEAAGWDAVWVWDHALRDRGVPYADPWILLAAIALATKRLRLGPMVTPLPRRRPWTVAREAVTLDRLSGGRVTLGVGLGAPLREFTAVGEDADPKVRAAKLDEGLEIVARCWTGETFSFAGQHYRLDDVEFLPVPLQEPRIPVWVAATWPVRAPFRRAVRWDGTWPLKRNPDGTSAPLTPEDVRGVRELLTELRPSSALPGSALPGPAARPSSALPGSALPGPAARPSSAPPDSTAEPGSAEPRFTDPFDILVAGVTPVGDPARGAAIAGDFAEAGATWWTERINPARGSLDDMRARVRQGPPRI